MARLPVPGGDNDDWGNILNEYLSHSLDSQGKLKNNSVDADALVVGSVVESKLSTEVRTKLNVSTNKSSIGLGNVDDTSDANKPVSSLMQAALDTKLSEQDLDAAAAELVQDVSSGLSSALELNFMRGGSVASGAAWGSSSIAGTGATASTNLVGRLATLLGVPIYNGGNGGELVTHHAARSGAIPALVTIADGLIPASGAVAVTVENFTAARLDRLKSYSGSLASVPGTVAYSGGTLRFTRASSGSPLRIAPKTPFLPNDSDKRQLFTLLWPGKNTLVDSPSDSQQVIDYTHAMDRYLGGTNSRNIILGHFTDAGTSAGSSVRSAINRVNEQYATDFGERFIDIQSFVTSRYIWYVSGVSPLQSDLDEQAAGNKPTSLAYDGLHFNEAGYNAIAWFVLARLKQLGWFPTVTLPALPAEPTFPVISIPAKITGLAVVPHSGSLSASWDVSPTATSYQVQTQIGGGSWNSVTVAGNAATISGANGTAISVRVAGINAAGTGAYSDVQVGTPEFAGLTTFTSDSFSGANETTLIARNSDAALGGTAKTWLGSTSATALAIVSNTLRRGSTVASQFAAFTMPSQDQSVSAKIVALPTVGILYLPVRRQALAASDQYRVNIGAINGGSSTIALKRFTSGAESNIGGGAVIADTIVAGDTVEIRVIGTTVGLYKNSVLVGEATDTVVTGAGYAGVSVDSQLTSMTLDDIIIKTA